MFLTRRVVLAIAVGSSLSAMECRAGDDKPSAPDEESIKAIVAHFAKNGVKLEKERDNWWVVTDPKGTGYEVIVAWRTFPAKATEEEMKAELKTINLAFMLNAPTRVAMSFPGLRATGPAEKLPKLDDVAVAAKLKRLFKEYRPPEPTK